MVKHLYTGSTSKVDYLLRMDEEGPHLTTEEIKHVTTYYAGIWVLADMYNISDLKEQAVRHFGQWLRAWYSWDHDVDVIFRVVDAMDELGWIPCDIQKTTSRFLARELGRPHEHKIEKVEELIDKHGDLAKDVLKLMVSGHYHKTHSSTSPSTDAANGAEHLECCKHTMRGSSVQRQRGYGNADA